MAGTDSGTAHVMRVSDCAVMLPLSREDGDEVRAICVSLPDGIIVCAHKSGQVKVWDAGRATNTTKADENTGARRQTPRHSGRVLTLSTSSCGQFVASGGIDCTVRCWRTDTGWQLWSRDCGSPIRCVCVSADGAHVACGRHDGTVHVLDMCSGEILLSWRYTVSVFSVCVQKLSDNLIWSGHANGEVVAWSCDRSTPKHRFKNQHRNHVVDLAVSAGSRRVYSQDSQGCTTRINLCGNKSMRTETMLNTPWASSRQAAQYAFAEHTAQGFRTGRHMCVRSRVRHVHDDRVYDITATIDGASTLNVELELPGCNERPTITTTFDFEIHAVDASFLRAGKGYYSFAQVVCGLNNGRVCILRQPLTEAMQHWHPA